MNHRQALIDIICLALAQYIAVRDDVPVYDLLHALDAVQHRITEQLIKDHPELVPELSHIMNSTKH